MISFIIIGRNEGWKLKKCINSVIKTIEYNKLNEYEIIYIDSKSSDKSVAVAKEFKKVKTFVLTKDMNAAIARNVGADLASGSTLFFIDGDMEILEDFLPLVYSEERGLDKKFVSGNWMNIFYNNEDILLSKELFLQMTKDQIERTTGGLFLISKKAWESVGGMDNKFKKSQDIDLGLRLAKNNIFLIRKNKIAANHHTISYLNKKRMWDDFFSWDHLYVKSLLYRTHVFNKHVYRRFFRNDYTLILLGLLLFFLMFNKIIALTILVVYFSLLFIKSKLDLNKVLYYLVRDVTVLVGFFLFYPKHIFKIKYTKA